MIIIIIMIKRLLLSLLLFLFLQVPCTSETQVKVHPPALYKLYHSYINNYRRINVLLYSKCKQQRGDLHIKQGPLQHFELIWKDCEKCSYQYNIIILINYYKLNSIAGAAFKHGCLTQFKHCLNLRVLVSMCSAIGIDTLTHSRYWMPPALDFPIIMTVGFAHYTHKQHNFLVCRCLFWGV